VRDGTGEFAAESCAHARFSANEQVVSRVSRGKFFRFVPASQHPGNIGFFIFFLRRVGDIAFAAAKETGPVQTKFSGLWVRGRGAQARMAGPLGAEARIFQKREILPFFFFFSCQCKIPLGAGGS